MWYKWMTITLTGEIECKVRVAATSETPERELRLRAFRKVLDWARGVTDKEHEIRKELGLESTDIG